MKTSLEQIFTVQSTYNLTKFSLFLHFSGKKIARVVLGGEGGRWLWLISYSGVKVSCTSPFDAGSTLLPRQCEAR